MVIILLISTFTFGLVTLLLMLGGLVSKKITFDKNKSRPFECGFSPKFNYRIPFSIRFYLISIIFLIFDVELILLFPIVVRSNFFFRNKMILTIIFFLGVLILGLYHECNQRRLK